MFTRLGLENHLRLLSQINSFVFSAVLPREVTEQGCLCQQWTLWQGPSFLGNCTTATGELSF